MKPKIRRITSGLYSVELDGLRFRIERMPDGDGWVYFKLRDGGKPGAEKPNDVFPTKRAALLAMISLRAAIAKAKGGAP